ncbi:MAG: hypothetical protein WAK31_30130, partial [Chthoniobacterales bacterium]
NRFFQPYRPSITGNWEQLLLRLDASGAILFADFCTKGTVERSQRLVLVLVVVLVLGLVQRV